MTVISGETDEGADAPDDEAVLLALLEPDTARQTTDLPAADWPMAAAYVTLLPVETETVAWFKANHDDWRREIGTVLRGWIAARDRDVRSVVS